MREIARPLIRAVLQDALESAEDEKSIATPKRILTHLDLGSLDTLGRS